MTHLSLNVEAVMPPEEDVTVARQLEELGPDHFTMARVPRVYDCLLGEIETYQPDRDAALDLYQAAPALHPDSDRDRAPPWHPAVPRPRLRTAASPRPPSPRAARQSRCRRRLGPRRPRPRDVPTRPRTPYATSVVPADLLDMETLLTRHGLAGAFDLDRPIAVTVHDVLPWNPDDTAVADAMAVLRPWLPVGSTLSIAHLAHHFNPRTVPQAVAAYERHGITIRPATWINSCAQEYRTRKLTAPRHIHQLVALGIELTEDRRCRRL